MIKFSIITVCLNAGDDLVDTVTCTLAQTYEDFEIIVKDGLSTDGSVERLPADPRIRLIRQEDTGIYDAMNQGVDASTGDYLIFMNAGDKFYNTDTLEKIGNIIKQAEMPCYYGLCYNRKMNHVNAYPQKITPMTCYRTMICHQSIVYSRRLFAEHPYDTSYKVLADKEYLMWMVCRKKISPVYMDFIVVDYKADGACENPENIKRNNEDLDRMKREYYTASQLKQYRLLHSLTLPGVRRYVTSRSKFSGAYYKLLRTVYKIVRKR